MTSDNNSPLRARPSKYASRAAPPRSTKRRLALRLLGLPVLGVAAVLLYNGLSDYVVLPTCDSERAKKSLSEVLKQLNFDPVRYEPIKTVSSGKEEVVCNAVLPLPGGGNVVADFTFYWQGSKANMRYSISRKS
jgi:hypothetical protein